MSYSPEMVWLVCSFFLIAALYSSVGFGGGSSYLALLALFLPNFLEIKSTALLCNLVVVSGGSYLFYKEGLFDFRKFLPLALCSVPAAFFGATFHLTESTFFVCLGSVLAFSGIMLVGQLFLKPLDKPFLTGNSTSFNVGLGTSSGFLSGLVGIGGGILISPVLHLLRWGAPKKIAALSSFFILVNSVAGLLGQVSSSTFKVEPQLLVLLLAAVFCGGQIGTRFSLHKIKPEIIKALTGGLVFYIGANLVWKYSF